MFIRFLLYLHIFSPFFIPISRVSHGRSDLRFLLGENPQLYGNVRAETGREVRVVSSEVRPVPLDWSYLFTTVREAVFQLYEQQKAPVYCVSFTQDMKCIKMMY